MSKGKLKGVAIGIWGASMVLLAAALTALWLTASASQSAAEQITGEGARAAGRAKGIGKKGAHVNDHNTDLDAMKAKLSQEQYDVCFNAATEPPFTGKYWNNHEAGDYVCVACGQELFSSAQKFDSGTGWPSFYDAVDKGRLTLKRDGSFGMVRTEVLCGKCGAHLGHMFDDGPKPTGLRYCINSAALDFKPAKAQQ